MCFVNSNCNDATVRGSPGGWRLLRGALSRSGRQAPWLLFWQHSTEGGSRKRFSAGEIIYIFTHIGCFGFEPSHARPFLFVDLWQILVRWGARRYRRAVPVPGHSGAAVLFGPTVCLNAVLPTPHTYTDVFCLFPSGLGSWVSGPGSSGLLGPFPGPVPCSPWALP